MTCFSTALGFGLGLLTCAAGASLPAPAPARLRADLEFLCSPALSGRETGTPGATRAASFIAERMGALALSPIRAGGLGGPTPYHQTWEYEGPWNRGPAATGPTLDDPASNLVAVIAGSDPALARSYVFVTAHFDHLGNATGTLYPGADDNASGTAGLLELMRMLRRARPRRSIAFLAVSGEEEGLLGSEAYLDHPALPVTTIAAAINMDMIGRGRPGELHVMPTRKRDAMTTLVEQARSRAAEHGLILAAGIDQHWRNSDHYSFARRGIPAICFNTGVHEDYHRPTDTPDKIDFPKLAQVVAVIGDLVLSTANADSAPAPVPQEVWQAWAWAPFTSTLLPEGLAGARTEGCLPGFGPSTR